MVTAAYESLSESTEALMELLSTKSGNENLTQRCRDRTKEKRDGKSYVEEPRINDEKRREDKQRDLVNEWDNILSSEYGENVEDRSKYKILLGVHKENNRRLLAKLTSKLERGIGECYAQFYPGASEQYIEYMSNK
ncbi:protein Red [Nephila pilipes]|uniref:Protein Red n=1 Tax=Nephila pilipes TaxID=299642 RepID=A0A8X6Q682_NEPPI|nr:protein Red [Nephila pilipes]